MGQERDSHGQDSRNKILIALNEEDIKQLRELLKVTKKLTEILEHSLNEVTNH